MTGEQWPPRMNANTSKEGKTSRLESLVCDVCWEECSEMLLLNAGWMCRACASPSMSVRVERQALDPERRLREARRASSTAPTPQPLDHAAEQVKIAKHRDTPTHVLDIPIQEIEDLLHLLEERKIPGSLPLRKRVEVLAKRKIDPEAIQSGVFGIRPPGRPEPQSQR